MMTFNKLLIQKQRFRHPISSSKIRQKGMSALKSEIYTIPVSDQNDEDKFIIFRPLVGTAFVGNRTMAALAQKLLTEDAPVNDKDEAESFLRSIDFLAPDPPDPSEPGDEFAPSTAVLLLTNQCQLRCTYCYAAAGESLRKTLTPELGHAVIDAVYETARQRNFPQFEVSFHGGGEPTMAWRVLQDCVDWTRKKSIPAKVTLTSNGIWSPTQCSWIIQNLDGLSLSMDGGPSTQDQHRPFSSGIGSSSIVMRSLAELDRHHFSYNIRMTAAAPWKNLPRDVAFLCRESGCKVIQVEPAFNTKRGGHNDPSYDELEAFAEAYLEAVEIAAQAGRQFYYSGARLGTISTTFCSAPYNALIVNPDGDLIACYEVTSQDHPLVDISRIGRIENGQINIDHATRSRLHELMASRRESCRDCFCYWSCAGGCYTRSFGSPPDGHLHRGNLCELRQHLVKSLLLYGIARAGGVWRSGPLLTKRVAYVKQ